MYKKENKKESSFFKNEKSHTHTHKKICENFWRNLTFHKSQTQRLFL